MRRYHFKPWEFHRGGFVDVCECKGCGAVGDSMTLRYTRPCPRCGADVREAGAAEWVTFPNPAWNWRLWPFVPRKLGAWVPSPHNTAYWRPLS